MTWNLLVFGILPLIAFAIADTFAGLKWGVIVASLCALAEVLVIYFWQGEWDTTAIVATILIIIMGFVSLKLGNSIYFKFQPVVMAIFMAAFLAYMQIWGEPLVQRYAALIQKMAPPEKRDLVASPAFMSNLNDTVNWMVVVFLVHGAAVGYTAWRCSNLTWLLMRGVGFWVFAALILGVRMALGPHFSPL